MKNINKIKNLMTDKLLANIYTDFNSLINNLDLYIDKKIFHHFDNDRQDVTIGNYFPSDYYTMQIIWKEKIVNSNKHIEVYEQKVGTIIFDQFYAILRLKLPEEYLFNSVYSENHIFIKLSNYFPNAICFQMYKEYGQEFINEYFNQLSVLNYLNECGKTPEHYIDRLSLSFSLGSIVGSLSKNKDLNPRFLLDLEKRILMPNYKIEEKTKDDKVLLLESENNI